MKKITLFLLIIFISNLDAFAQFPENFNSGLPAGWATFIGTNGLGTTENWEHITGTGINYMAVGFEDVTGGLAEDWLVTPQVAITTANSLLTFDQTDLNAPDYGSVLTVRISTNSQTNHTDFVIIDTQTELEITNEAAAVFSEHTVDLSAYEGDSVYIAFVWTQDDGDILALTNIDLQNQYIDPPNPAITPTPANGATDVVVTVNPLTGEKSITLDWEPDTSGEAASSYDFYFGISPISLNLIASDIPDIVIPLTGINFYTQYFWQIIPKNAGGEAIDAPIWSFTTEADVTITPPDSVTTPTPINGAMNVSVDVDAMSGEQSVFLDWEPATTGEAATRYEIYWGIDISNLNLLGTTTSEEITIFGIAYSTKYFWQIIATNDGGGATGTPIWSFTTEAELAIDDLTKQAFHIYPNPAKDFINIKSQLNLNTVDIYNQLGQQVLKIKANALLNNSVDIKNLNKGMYLMMITADNNKQETIRFIKD